MSKMIMRMMMTIQAMVSIALLNPMVNDEQFKRIFFFNFFLPPKMAMEFIISIQLLLLLVYLLPLYFPLPS